MRLQFLSPSWWIASTSITKILPFLFVVSKPRLLFRQFSATTKMNDTTTTFKPIQIGLTGSIGMGKSTITGQLKRLGFPVFDADEAVHQLYSTNGEAVAPLQALFPDAIVNNSVDRKELMKYVMSDAAVVKEIEKIVHPLVIAKREKFLVDATEKKELLIIYDIPLLFENKYRFDYHIVVTADAETQKSRVLQRPGMTQEKFESILSKQLSDEHKRQLADYLIFSNYESKVEGRAQLALVLEDILLKKEKARFDLWRLTAFRATPKPMPTTPRNLSPRAYYGVKHLSDVIDAVVFDLDDTLVPVAGPISAAALKLHEMSHRLLPKTIAKHGEGLIHAVRKIMHKLKDEQPLISHDLTEMRVRSLHHLAKEHDEHEQVPVCVEEFLKVRSQVSEYLYPDTVQCLETFQSKGVKLGILTNGNAYLHEDKDFAQYFQFFLTASDIGAAKPSPVGFLACCQYLQLSPSRILYVGDSYEKDIIGAKAAGMKTAMLYRPEEQNSTVAAAAIPSPDQHADIVITSLDPIILEQKILEKFAS